MIHFPETFENGYLPVREYFYIVAYPILLITDSTNTKEFKKQPKTSKIYLGHYARKKFKTKIQAQIAIDHLNQERQRQSLNPIEYKIEGGGLPEIHNEFIRKHGFNCRKCGKPIRQAQYEGRIVYFHRNVAIKNHKALPTVEVIQSLHKENK